MNPHLQRGEIKIRRCLIDCGVCVVRPEDRVYDEGAVCESERTQAIRVVDSLVLSISIPKSGVIWRQSYDERHTFSTNVPSSFFSFVRNISLLKSSWESG